MPLYRAAWLLPVSQPPIRDAWIEIDRGRIVAFGDSTPNASHGSDPIDLGRVAILPGLVNAHTHLELSWMRGRMGQTSNCGDWIRSVIDLKNQSAEHRAEIARAIRDAIDESLAFGTAVIGDISNTMATPRPLAASRLAAAVFHELLGFRAQDAAAIVEAAKQRLQAEPASDTVRCTLAAHAPYSVSPALFDLIRVATRQNPLVGTSIHLGESSAEVEFLRDGTGPCRTALEHLGKWDPSWEVPKCSPVDYIDGLGFLNDRLLVVHGVKFGAKELRQLASSKATLVTCPRGNRLTGAGLPPIVEFYESGARVAVGTDSLASVPDLNVFAELAEMRRLAPRIPARLLIESATRTGARALGFAADFGTIDTGKRDRLIAVAIDRATTDIEEQLVSGVHRSQIRWLSS